ncbi:MAG: hypothetical protein ACOC5E_03790, partial [Acidobacteriota bacterium]
ALYRGHGDGRFWLVLDDDEGLHGAWSLRVSREAPGYALVATQGHGLRVVALDPLAGPGRAGGADDAPPDARRTDGAGVRQSPRRPSRDESARETPEGG